MVRLLKQKMMITVLVGAVCSAGQAVMAMDGAGPVKDASDGLTGLGTNLGELETKLSALKASLSGLTKAVADVVTGATSSAQAAVNGSGNGGAADAATSTPVASTMSSDDQATIDAIKAKVNTSSKNFFKTLKNLNSDSDFTREKVAVFANFVINNLKTAEISGDDVLTTKHFLLSAYNNGAIKTKAMVFFVLAAIDVLNNKLKGLSQTEKEVLSKNISVLGLNTADSTQKALYNTLMAASQV